MVQSQGPACLLNEAWDMQLVEGRGELQSLQQSCQTPGEAWRSSRTATDLQTTEAMIRRPTMCHSQSGPNRSTSRSSALECTYALPWSSPGNIQLNRVSHNWGCVRDFQPEPTEIPLKFVPLLTRVDSIHQYSGNLNKGKGNTTTFFLQNQPPVILEEYFLPSPLPPPPLSKGNQNQHSFITALWTI